MIQQQDVDSNTAKSTSDVVSLNIDFPPGSEHSIRITAIQLGVTTPMPSSNARRLMNKQGARKLLSIMHNVNNDNKQSTRKLLSTGVKKPFVAVTDQEKKSSSQTVASFGIRTLLPAEADAAKVAGNVTSTGNVTSNVASLDELMQVANTGEAAAPSKETAEAETAVTPAETTGRVVYVEDRVYDVEDWFTPPFDLKPIFGHAFWGAFDYTAWEDWEHGPSALDFYFWWFLWSIASMALYTVVNLIVGHMMNCIVDDKCGYCPEKILLSDVHVYNRLLAKRHQVWKSGTWQLVVIPLLCTGALLIDLFFGGQSFWCSVLQIPCSPLLFVHSHMENLANQKGGTIAFISLLFIRYIVSVASAAIIFPVNAVCVVLRFIGGIIALIDCAREHSNPEAETINAEGSLENTSIFQTPEVPAATMFSRLGFGKRTKKEQSRLLRKAKDETEDFSIP